MAKILLHDQQYKIGGPRATLDSIEACALSGGHEVVRIAQTEACGFNPVKAIRFVRHYRREINEHHGDSIYICGLQYAGFLMTLAAKLSNVKRIVLSVHGSEWDSPERTLRKWLLMHIVEPLEVRWADSIVTVCQEAQNHIKALACARRGCNDGVIYNTMPADVYEQIETGKVRMEFGIAEDKIVVAVVGRVVEGKGHAFIMDAIKKIADDSFVFLIVGDGDYLYKYHERCGNEIEAGKVILTGARNDVNNILKDSDIFLFATLHENHSIALLEAVNMKCAALCTNVGGNPEIIEDGKGGILMPLKNSDAIVDGLLRLKDRDLRERYCEHAKRDAVEKFSPENTVGKLLNILADEK